MEVVFPNELLVALKGDPESFRQKVLLYTLGKLYEIGRIFVIVKNILNSWEKE